MVAPTCSPGGWTWPIAAWTPPPDPILIQAVFPNEARTLRPGQSVKVRIRTDEVKNAILVPQRAVNQLQNLYSVYLLNDSNKVTSTPVKVGQRVGENWVITEGVTARPARGAHRQCAHRSQGGRDPQADGVGLRKDLGELISDPHHPA